MEKNQSTSASTTSLPSLSLSTPVTEPPSSPLVDQPNLSGEEEKLIILKTPEKILTDLTTNNDTNGGGSLPPSPPPPSPPQMMTSGAIATAVGGGAVVLGGGNIIGPVKRRKASEIIDPPSGTPTCPICSKTFSSWKGAFGHMRKHPDRQYRGFFKPPTFPSASSKAATNASGNRHEAAGEEGSSADASGEVGEGGASPAVRNLLFDLNLPVEGVVEEEGKIVLGFDLNEPAAGEEEEEKEDKQF
ncbi:uncharacterized protein LOC130980289 [Arachis stenosperma]|uniref:uncharacterized protein LOC130980289 n=1 Tax=Arachis stenosperma TaxID=217475 RepID=UPI0025ABE173|nr:uncharacterized protein LOC130980289 [Arachis stenosperma]